MSWIQEFNAIFFVSIATIVVGALGVGVKFCLKSKCEKFNCCCGLVQIDRRVDLETQEHLRELELGIKDDEKTEEIERPSLDLATLSKK